MTCKQFDSIKCCSFTRKMCDFKGGDMDKLPLDWGSMGSLLYRRPAYRPNITIIKPRQNPLWRVSVFGLKCKSEWSSFISLVNMDVHFRCLSIKPALQIPQSYRQYVACPYISVRIDVSRCFVMLPWRLFSCYVHNIWSPDVKASVTCFVIPAEYCRPVLRNLRILQV